jgi:hypothetical protein
MMFVVVAIAATVTVAAFAIPWVLIDLPERIVLYDIPWQWLDAADQTELLLRKAERILSCSDYSQTNNSILC